EGVTQVHVGGGQVADGGVGAGVLGDGAVGEGDVGGRLVDVGHRERELLFGRQAEVGRAAGRERVAAVGLEVEGSGGTQAGAQDGYGLVRVVEFGRVQGLCEGVTQVHVGGGQVADGGVGAGVLGDGAVGEGDVGGRLVDVGHRERELLFGRQA